MKIVVEYHGNIYESAEIKTHTAEQLKDKMFKNIEDIGKFEMELNRGGFIVIGEDAIKSCIIRFFDT